MDLLSRSLIVAALSIIQLGQLTWAAEPPNVLDLPKIMQQQAAENDKGVLTLRGGNPALAQTIFRANVERVPHDVVAWYNLACCYAMQNKTEEGIESLQQAIKLGFRSRLHLERDADLESLRKLPQFDALKEACKQPPAESIGWRYSVTVAKPDGMSLKVDSQNMLFNPQQHLIQVLVDVGDSGEKRLVSGLEGKVGDLLIEWRAAGTASGNVGDLYDNHDKAHSPLDLKQFPQMTAISYGPEVQKRQLDNGAQQLFLYLLAKSDPEAEKKIAPAKPDGGNGNLPSSEPATGSPDSAEIAKAANISVKVSKTVVLGNSSTALTGSIFWRSMPRYLLTAPHGVDALINQYISNHLYVYPEHKDHDAGSSDGEGWGDIFHANTPYYIVTQGSSGSDQPFLKALAATLAAFGPTSKQRLVETGLMSPTMQMIFRRSSTLVNTDADYLTGRAHPTVFDSANLDMQRMVEMAHAMKPDELPPVCSLRLLNEQLGNPARDYFDAAPSEVALNSPFAVSRVCHNTAFWRVMEVEAVGSDLNKRPVVIHWRVLRGDPELTLIEPIEGRENARRIRVGYQKRSKISSESAIESARVDIGVFADNGVYRSAPAIISFYFPQNQQRTYDNQQRIQAVDYVAGQKHYADPALVPARDWRDEYSYAPDGSLLGWTRKREGKPSESFNADGQYLVPSVDGQPSRPVAVEYKRHPDLEGRNHIRYSLPRR